MNGINQVILFGLLGQDPELKTTPSGKHVCNLSIATNRSQKKDDGWVEITEWHRVTLWEQQAELAHRFLRKGSAVGIDGELRTESWTDKEGNKQSRVVIHGRKMHLVPSRRASELAESPSTKVHPAFNGQDMLTDQIPF